MSIWAWRFAGIRHRLEPAGVGAGGLRPALSSAARISWVVIGPFAPWLNEKNSKPS